jgi:hypothetical protein
MFWSKFRLRVLIFAAYLLAAVLPVMALGDGRVQSQTDHAQMMAMAGHVAHMPITDAPDDDAQRMLCQQHCLFAAVALPEPSRTIALEPRATEIDVDFDLLFASLATPPPGHPPKIAVN